jgi:excisionase family DNA binding protein
MKTEEVGARRAAQILGVNLQFLYQLIWSGKLSGRKVAGTWRIPKAAIETRLKQRGEGHA